MNNNCKVDFINKEICVTKKFYAAAQHFGTQEFELMCQLQERMPHFKIVFQSIPQAVKHAWYPTYSQMVDFIRNKTQDENALHEIDDIILYARISGKGYNMVRQWFLQKYDKASDEQMNEVA